MPVMYVVTNEAGSVIATARELVTGDALGGIAPGPKQRLHILPKLDAELLKPERADDFHSALTRHLKTTRDKHIVKDPEAYIYERVEKILGRLTK